MKHLENLNYACRWTTHLGCIKSCLDYLGIEMSEAWLYGGTGHAFVLNIHSELCPSGPTAWKSLMLFELANNLGYRIAGEHAHKSEPGFADKQRRAYEHVTQAIDRGLPCYGWELDIPEFYVVYGYDDVGYYYKGVNAEAGKGPKRWQDVGQTDIGFFELYSIDHGTPADDATIVKSAFQAALKHASGTSEYILEQYHSGLAGYDTWIAALEGGTADRGGLGYNTAVWAECRRNAVGFLREARERLGSATDTLLNDAIGHYQTVSAKLDEVERLYPFDMASYGRPADVDETSQQAVSALRAAREAEACGHIVLEQTVAAL